MRSRLLAYPSLLSLVLCVVAAALWVRSYWVMDQRDETDMSFVERGDDTATRVFSRRRQFTSYRGVLVLLEERPVLNVDPAGISLIRRARHEVLWMERAVSSLPRGERFTPAARTLWQELGFCWFRESHSFGPGSTVSASIVATPYWASTLVLAILPCVWGFRIARRQMRLRYHAAVPAHTTSPATSAAFVLSVERLSRNESRLQDEQTQRRRLT